MDNKSKKKRKRVTILERKIRYYFNRYDSYLSLEAFELLLISEFDENSKLVFDGETEKFKKFYTAYWKRFSNGN